MSDDRARGEAPEGNVPAAEEQRRRAVDLLCEAFADDRLSVEDFETRVDLVHQAETVGQLRTLLAAVPGRRPPVSVEAEARPGDAKPEGRALARPLPRAALHPDHQRAHSLLVGVLGGGSRRGSWIPARTNWAVGVLGGFELDFREASLSPGVTQVKVFAACGGGEVIVPPDVVVEVSGIGILGGFEQRNDAPSAPTPDSPVLRVSGLALLGGVTVVVRYPGETSRDAKKRKRLERRARRKLRSGGS